MAEQNKLEEVIRTSLEHIRSMVDANTVVGTPISTPAGTTIIPISKISVGYASGGTDFGKEPPKNFAGGGGTGLTVQPVCFLAISPEGNVEMIPLDNGGNDSSAEKLAALLDKAPLLFGKLKNVFKKKKQKAEDEEEDEAAAAADETIAEEPDAEV